ncbi:nacht and tpr domain protein [Diplodia corticola]|uniref:Nacht and tpr domain protein n=1 Tax=Diplodia corticola TaxID=236234 RepID=A0A1J9QME7_9PEZI|nr:nacht and tpr domain protein [Diplodia corticola]OJD29649.1 nacht and tpr domain protein [Diplodia corticola]
MQSGSPEPPISVSYLPVQPPDAPLVSSRSDHSLPTDVPLTGSQSDHSLPPDAPLVRSRSDHSLPQTGDLPKAEPIPPPLGSGLSRSSSAPPEALVSNMISSVESETSGILSFKNDKYDLWKEAFSAYSKEHKDWNAVFEVLSPEPKQNGIRVAVKKFEKYRNRHEKFYKAMDMAMKFGETTINVFGDAVKGAFPPASILFGISTVFFSACKGVSEAHDAIEKMLEHLDFFMMRLTIHQETMTDPLRDTLAKSLKIMLEVLGFITSAASGKQWTRVKLFLGGDEWKVKQADLDRYARFEGHIVMAETRNWVMQKDSKNDISPKDTEIQEKRKKALSPRAECSIQFFHGIKGSIVGNTGNWIEATTEYKDWQKGRTPVLLVSGPTGFGKTYLCANIISRILSKGDEDEQNILLPFFGRQGLELPDVLRTWAFDLSLKDRAYQKHVDGVIKESDNMRKLRSTTVLWKRLFLDFQAQNSSDLKEDPKRIYLVLDGLDTTNTDHKHIDAFLKLMRDYQDSGRSPQAELKTTQGPIFRILIMSRLDQVDFKAHEGLNHHEITKKELENDIRQYIHFHLVNLEDKEEHTKRLSRRLSRLAESFAWASIIIGSIQRDPSPRNIQQIIREPPKTDSGLIESIVNRIERASSDNVCKVLNTLLMWLIYSRKSITLEDLDCIFKIKDRYRQGVSDLEGTLKTYPSLFRLTAVDGPASDEPATEIDQAKSAMLPLSREEILSTKLKRDRRQTAHFRNVTVEFSQQSIEDYFRNYSRSGHSIYKDYPLPTAPCVCRPSGS